MTLNEICTMIASHMDKEFDEPFKLIIAEKVRVWRSRLIKNSVDKDERERKFFIQTVFMRMEERNEAECEVPYTQCKVAWSVDKVPKPLRANGMLFDYIGSLNGMNAFKSSPVGMMTFMQAGRYSANVIYYLYENEKIKVYGNSKLPIIRIDGIFDDPEAAAQLSCGSINSKCNFWNEEYPASGDIIQLIIQSILQIDYNRVPYTETKQIPVIRENYAKNIPSQ